MPVSSSASSRERLRRRADHDINAIAQHVQVAIGDQDCHLDQRVTDQVQPGHLTVDPDEFFHRGSVTEPRPRQEFLF